MMRCVGCPLKKHEQSFTCSIIQFGGGGCRTEWCSQRRARDSRPRERANKKGHLVATPLERPAIYALKRAMQDYLGLSQQQARLCRLAAVRARMNEFHSRLSTPGLKLYSEVRPSAYGISDIEVRTRASGRTFDLLFDRLIV